MLGKTVQQWNNLHSQTIQLQTNKPGTYTLKIFEHATMKQVVKKVVILQ
jgi:hypothetical protein